MLELVAGIKSADENDEIRCESCESCESYHDMASVGLTNEMLKDAESQYKAFEPFDVFYCSECKEAGRAVTHPDFLKRWSMVPRDTVRGGLSESGVSGV